MLIYLLVIYLIFIKSRNMFLKESDDMFKITKQIKVKLSQSTS
jgi:hypothetical protein